jgi:DNA-binding NarL/FixJ family response regulator
VSVPNVAHLPVRVLVVDDHWAFADALCLALEARDDLACAGSVGSVDDAIEAIPGTAPDLVLMDLNLPGVDGIEGTRRIRVHHPDLRVVVLTGQAELHRMTMALEAGACGFLLKEGRLVHLLDAIAAPGGPGVVVDQTTLTRLAERAGGGGGHVTGGRRRAPVLTPRELDVMELMGRGLTPHAVARRLGISVHTCRGNLKTIYSKLDVHSQVEAVVVAARLGLIQSCEAGAADRGSSDARPLVLLEPRWAPSRE